MTGDEPRRIQYFTGPSFLPWLNLEISMEI